MRSVKICKGNQHLKTKQFLPFWLNQICLLQIQEHSVLNWIVPDPEFSQSEVLHTPKTSPSAGESFEHMHGAILWAFPLDDYVSNFWWYLYLQTSTKQYKMHTHALVKRNYLNLILIVSQPLPKTQKQLVSSPPCLNS